MELASIRVMDEQIAGNVVRGMVWGNVAVGEIVPEIRRKCVIQRGRGEGGGKGGKSKVSFCCYKRQCGRVRDALATR